MNRLVINANREKSVINRNIYGHFAEHLGRCIYGGLYLDGALNAKVVEALKAIAVPVLRWPGGCFADEYHWKDGIGDKSMRRKTINTHWGGVIEDNSFGTHEFFELCEALGCEPYVNGNVGSGTIQEMSDWIEYMTHPGGSTLAELRAKNGRVEPWKLTYFGIGNENWGGGGNMRPEYYADVYRRYQTFAKGFGESRIYKIACGAGGGDYNWTEVVMKNAGRFMNALSLHHYTIPTGNWGKKGSSTDFPVEEFYSTLKNALYMDELIENHARIMSRYDPGNRVGIIVDEWGTWFDPEPGSNPGFLYQQNTMRDALVAAVTLNIFNNRSDRVVMANLAQTVNVLQAVLLTDGEKVIKTPTYHVFDLYKAHQDATLLESYVAAELIGTDEAKVPNLHVSASKTASGETHITLANLSATDSCAVECEIGAAIKSARILTGAMGDHNTFDKPETVSIALFADYRNTESGFTLTAPACSVLELVL